MRRLGVWTLAASLVCLGGAPAFGAPDPDGSAIELSVQVPGATSPPTVDGGSKLINAELSWGINLETRGRTYFGDCNFVMAGWPGPAGNAGSASAWEERGSQLYQAESGTVSVVNAKGVPVGYHQRCSDPGGQPVQGEPAASFTDHQIRFSQGSGQINRNTGQAQISWQGTVTVVFYDGLVYFWFRDPVLNLAANGSASLTATLGGYGSDRNDASQWVRFFDSQVTLAEGQAIVKNEGVVLQPNYQGVSLTNVKDQKLGAASTHPGAWPQSFVTFQQQTGLSQYWYSTGNNHDYRKPPDALYISWDASESISQPPPTETGRQPVPPGGDGSGGSGNTGTSGSNPPNPPSASATPAQTGSNPPASDQPDGVNPAGSGPSPWDGQAQPAVYQAEAPQLVPELPTDQPGRGLLVPISLLVIICTLGLSLVGLKQGWFQNPWKG